MPSSARDRRRAVKTGRSADLTAALNALDAEELRAFVQEALDRLDDGPRGQLEDALVQRAAAQSRWRPAAPSSEKVDEAKRFAVAARHVGQADPSDVDEYLRQGVTASLAGDHAAARAIFEALLPPIASADIDLGQHEMVDEVLSVDLHDCISRYLAAVSMTTPVAHRAEALFAAAELGYSLTYLQDPLAVIERVLGPGLPDFDPFLAAWIERLELNAGSHRDWESEHDRWLREAVTRREGLAGLERIARTTKRPEAVRAWCDAVVAVGDWSKSLTLYEEAADLVSSDFSRGDFLDGAALAAQVLRRKDATKKLEAAWLGAPSLPRLLRWLLAEDPSSATIKKRAASALNASAPTSARLLGLLHVVVDDVPSAAALLQKAPGLGWSTSDHPGHLVVPVFAWMFGVAPVGSVREQLAQALHRPLVSEYERGLEEAADPNAATKTAPRLPSPIVIDVLQRAGILDRLTATDRASALAAVKTAATKRTDGVLGEKRRRHYAHAALLVACCVELEGAVGNGAGVSNWVEALRARTSRFPAFQEELRSALAQARRMAAP